MAKTPPDNGAGLSESAKAARQAQPVLDAVWRFVGGAGVGVGAGILLDRWLKTTPAFTVGLMMLGLGVGFWGMYRVFARKKE